MRESKLKQVRKARRIRRVRKRVSGSPDRPRMAVVRTLRNIEVQIIDDLAGKTLCSASTLSKELRGEVGHGGGIAAAQRVGKAIAEKAKAQGIERVAFDRRGRRYHGRIKALADAAREGGLKF